MIGYSFITRWSGLDWVLLLSAVLIFAVGVVVVVLIAKPTTP